MPSLTNTRILSNRCCPPFEGGCLNRPIIETALPWATRPALTTAAWACGACRCFPGTAAAHAWTGRSPSCCGASRGISAPRTPRYAHRVRALPCAPQPRPAVFAPTSTFTLRLIAPARPVRLATSQVVSHARSCFRSNRQGGVHPRMLPTSASSRVVGFWNRHVVGPAAGAHGGLQVGPGAGGAGLELPADPVKGVAPCCPVITRGRGGPRRIDVQWRRRTASGTCTSAATITWRSPPAAETVRGRRRRARSKAAADGRALVVHTHIHTHKRATLRCD